MGVCAGGESQTTEDRRESRQVGAGRVGRELRGDEREGEERRGRCDRCPARRAEPARGGAEGQGGEAHQRGREEGDRCERARERQQPGQSDLRGERVVAHREVPLHQVDGARPTRAHPSERLGKVVGQRVEAQPRSLEQDDRRRGHRTAERAPASTSAPPPRTPRQAAVARTGRAAVPHVRVATHVSAAAPASAGADPPSPTSPSDNSSTTTRAAPTTAPASRRSTPPCAATPAMRPAASASAPTAATTRAACTSEVPPISGPDDPGRAAAGPEVVQRHRVLVGIHALPEALVSVGRELAHRGESLERLALEHGV
jgi:hypothetical protein